ncbi:ABC transporter ATP-binding protein [Actinoallomurus bryophytorum]|uniref:ATP-binding cassette subfamily B protein n=1 Tax=Actinoallomurus bryophytorum TaxID=1490222 RepID=A0A543BZL1_9ACTN|nr:ABC transporter ATP-binding protein [Actinoallomurus bryophytorum]TQL90260.1 ATP-binding cassette subfamily B protein [Actinoallomurus bryophytorum]
MKPPGDELFGSGIRVSIGQLRHEGAGLLVGFSTMARELPRLLAATIRLGREAAPRALAAIIVAELVAGVGTAVTLLSTYRVLVPLMAGGPSRDRVLAAAPALVAIALAAGTASVMRACSKAAASRLGPRAERLAYTRLLEGAAQVELAALEDAEFHNLLGAARQGTRATRIALSNAIALLTGLTNLVASAGVLTVLHPVLLPLLAAGIAPKGWSAVRAARARFASTKRYMDLTRQLEVLGDLLSGPNPGQEIRAHGVAPFLLEHYRRLSAVAEEEQERLGRAEARNTLVGDALSGLAGLATYAALGALLLTGAVPLAVAGAAVMAIRTGKMSLTALVMSTNQIYEQGLFVLEWERACAEAGRLAMHTGHLALPPRAVEIRAENLRFAYPHETRPALDGVDVVIRPGETVAFVGENGSGKSTLAKLLIGLYLPQGGQVTWAGVPIWHLDRRRLFERVALVTQDFTRWPFTARVNLAIGRSEHARDDARLRWAGWTSGADAVAASLPDGWDTLLAREFMGGTELSGGQWQRIGLGRAWFRDAPVLVFDEPTSALDPRAEIEVFDKVGMLAAQGRTIVLITHRLASVRRADRIYVLAHGKVVEHGTHQSLMDAGGAYAAMYQLQAGQYAETTWRRHGTERTFT